MPADQFATPPSPERGQYQLDRIAKAIEAQFHVLADRRYSAFGAQAGEALVLSLRRQTPLRNERAWIVARPRGFSWQGRCSVMTAIVLSGAESHSYFGTTRDINSLQAREVLARWLGPSDEVTLLPGSPYPGDAAADWRPVEQLTQAASALQPLRFNEVRLQSSRLRELSGAPLNL